MKKVHLEDLPNLRSFSCGDVVEWSSLENVVLNNCPRVIKFGLGITKESQLKSILITKNEVQIDPHTKLPYLFQLSDDKLSTITEYNVSSDEEISKMLDNLQRSHFTNLQILRAKNSSMLGEFLEMLMSRSHKLEVINIEQCAVSFLWLFNIYASKAPINFAKLKALTLEKVYEISYIWLYGSPDDIDLGNLQILHIKDVSSLGSIFSSYPADKLYQLKELIVQACEALFAIFGDHSWEVSPRAKLPSLSKVEFTSLPNLRQIYNGHLEFPSLKSLTIETCPLLTKFTTGFADSQHEMLTTDGESFFELNEIVFDSYDKMVCVISSETLQEFTNLKKLFVSHCKELKIVFNIRKQIPSSTQLLQQLCELALIHLPKLICIVNKEILKFYQNLKILQVKQCKSLNLLQVPLKLTNLEIYDCEALNNIIFIKDEEERREKLTFSELKDISLGNLPKLFLVFPSTSEFPSLQTLKIENCSSLRSFVEDSEALTESSITNYFFPRSFSVEKLKELHIINMDVEKLWHSNYPSESFCELQDLSLTNNNKLLTAISSSMIRRFKNLRKLTLAKCELLTEAFDIEDDNLDHKIHEILPQLRVLALIDLIKLKHVWNKEPQVLHFLNLVSLSIVSCGNLRSLFSLSTVKNLRKLNILKLCKCDKIEEVISSDIFEDGNISINFPELEYLVLEDLPMLVVDALGKKMTCHYQGID
ncbi:uncharacterized protein LOC106758256 [Vigna radiata var. radiata]|uniref:Uncharacterized protein LOC106758256 n=1 Tax=Vigna radiata var. radiata TaxID=3916 RepID=A0A1S3TSD1_VIGRR|nr:uncharacterized protein LOC106758256 [Vigna radiata var. radiata]